MKDSDVLISKEKSTKRSKRNTKSEEIATDIDVKEEPVIFESLKPDDSLPLIEDEGDGDHPNENVIEDTAYDSDASYSNAEAINYAYGTGKKLEHRQNSFVSIASSKVTYYPCLKDQPEILLAVFMSRKKKYIAGNIFEVEGIPGIESGGPSKVKVHARVLPAKRVIFRTKWTEVFAKKAVFMDEFKHSLSDHHRRKEKNLRFRVYGEKKCLGECYVDIEEFEQYKGTKKFWMTLLQPKKKPLKPFTE